MKYLIFGDIHGNLPAFEKLLKKERGNYDLLISHGDVVNYGPWSNECVDLLAEMDGAITLKGNHEEAFLADGYPGSNPVAKSFFDFCHPKFRRKEVIEKYGASYDLSSFRITHSYEGKYFYPDSNLSGYDFDKNLIIGHSHYAFDRTVGGKRIVNTGSLGQNRKFINVSNYIIYDDIAPQTIYLKSFVYNVDYVISKMESMCYPQLCLNYYKNKRRYK